MSDVRICAVDPSSTPGVILDQIEPVSRVLAVLAHPDDVDFGAAGSVAKWVSAGTEVIYCLVTDGDAGGFDPTIPRDQMPSIRQFEQAAAGKIVGVNQLEFLGYKDGELEVTTALRRDISRVIRRYRPDRVLCQSPERNYARIFSSHPDHLAAGEATLSAVYPDSRNPFTFVELIEEGLEAHSVKDVLLMAFPEPDCFEDVTGTFDKKLEAILAHASQHPDPSRIEPMVRGWLGAVAASAGLAKGSLAEAFKLVRT